MSVSSYTSLMRAADTNRNWEEVLRLYGAFLKEGYAPTKPVMAKALRAASELDNAEIAVPLMRTLVGERWIFSWWVDSTSR